MKAIFLDCAFVNPGDISWAPIEEQVDQLITCMSVEPDQVAETIGDSDICIVDSQEITAEIMDSCPELKMICVAATGFNHIDLKAACERGIAVTNVPAYSTEAVAQHTIALLLSICNQVDKYDAAVLQGCWSATQRVELDWAPILLDGLSMGIIGYGNIGRRVASIAEALGMKINVYSRDEEAAIKSDVVSLHCPLTKENEGMVNAEFISRMKDGAILLNTARGKLIDEHALSEALNSGKIKAAGLDVMAEEPPLSGSPLIARRNVYITPHMAFSPCKTREKVIDTCAANIKSFKEGGMLNRCEK